MELVATVRPCTPRRSLVPTPPKRSNQTRKLGTIQLAFSSAYSHVCAYYNICWHPRVKYRWGRLGKIHSIISLSTRRGEWDGITSWITGWSGAVSEPYWMRKTSSELVTNNMWKSVTAKHVAIETRPQEPSMCAPTSEVNAEIQRDEWVL